MAKALHGRGAKAGTVALIWREASLARIVGRQAGILLLVAVSMGPLYVMLVTSFYPADGFTSGNLTPPLGSGTLQNYTEAWNALGFSTMFKNSVIFTLASATAATALGSVAAYALIRFRFFGRRQLLAALIAAIAIPPIAIIMPLFLIMTSLNMVNELYSAILVETGLLIPFSVFLLYSFMRDLPQELFDAAAIDGAGPWRQFWHVAIPLSRSGLLVTVVIAGIFAWNELLVPLFFWGTDSLRTLMAGLAALGPGRTSTRAVPLLMAGVAISIIPLIILFLFTRRLLLRGLTEGSIR